VRRFCDTGYLHGIIFGKIAKQLLLPGRITPHILDYMILYHKTGGMSSA
jgi:hypothetical protein